MKLKELLKVIPKSHAISVYDYKYEGEILLSRETQNPDLFDDDCLEDEVMEVQGCTTYDDFENDDEFDGTDIVMIWIQHYDKPITITKKNRELERVVLENANLYNENFSVKKMKISNRLKHNLARGCVFTIEDILHRLTFDKGYDRHNYTDYDMPILYIRFMGEKTYNELLSYLVENMYELSKLEY